MSLNGRKYSCDSAAQTLEWLKAIVDFLSPFKFLLDAHVVNFFKDRLWESVDEQWMDCLRLEPVENLLHIPCGMLQEHWPASLREFILTARALVLPRGPEHLQKVFPDLHVTSLGSVIAQGMNKKKKHEVEILASVISTVAQSVHAQKIVDVGAGQGYLAQVLSFEYQLSVVAVDSSSYHGNVTKERAERIKKHYAAKMRRLQADEKELHVPQAISCTILSGDILRALACGSLHGVNTESSIVEKNFHAFEELKVDGGGKCSFGNNHNAKTPSVLAGLHACGDLSVTMLRAFLEGEEFKALVSIGCCYNLLSEKCSEHAKSRYGFPLSTGAELSGLTLGKNARDLACQSAERWQAITKETALQNFNVHAFRGAFQMVLYEHHPEVAITSPSIGRQGKALRRQQIKKDLQSRLHKCLHTDAVAVTAEASGGLYRQSKHERFKDGDACMASGRYNQPDEHNSCCSLRYEVAQSPDRSDKYSLFNEFCQSGLHQLGLETPHEMDLFAVWEKVQPFIEQVGPYWSLRAALGPVVETFILLDRLLLLQEHEPSIAAVMCPLFDPALSPRNIALIARRI